MNNTIFRISSQVLGCDVTLESSMSNVPGWDSLRTLQLVMALDEEGYFIPLEKIAELRTIGDIVAFAERKRDA